jgi:UDP-N-acetylglucosamine pyrophosphorylase
MENDGQSEPAIRAFEAAYAQLLAGSDPMIGESTISPVEQLPSLDALGSTSGAGAAELLEASVVIKLNGGLGTGMGLEKAKSLLPVREGQSFLDLIARQILHLREAHGMPLRFLLMSSFATQEDTANALAPYADLGSGDALQFLQSRIPKVDAETLAPAIDEAHPELSWCPPGHGDLYASLMGSGQLEQLLDRGVKYAFVSNSDNLGATLDLALLRYFAESGKAFLMEVTRRTAADRKGGHLAVDRETGRLLLRESAQCAAGDVEAFQDIDTHRYFNTNNLWLRLDVIKETLDEHGGLLPLPVIKNVKHLNPRDPSTRKVVQLEVAMGAAIGTLENTGAIVVDRSRFAPVKTTEDLFSLRSGAYVLTEDVRLELHPDRNGVPPNVVLEGAHYKLVDQLDACLTSGVPSLLGCERLEIRGPVQFEPGVIFKGKVTIENASAERQVVSAGTYADQTVELG